MPIYFNHFESDARMFKKLLIPTEHDNKTESKTFIRETYSKKTYIHWHYHNGFKIKSQLICKMDNNYS